MLPTRQFDYARLKNLGGQMGLDILTFQQIAKRQACLTDFPGRPYNVGKQERNKIARRKGPEFMPRPHASVVW